MKNGDLLVVGDADFGRMLDPRFAVDLHGPQNRK
jgi:hypothetical protein